MSDTPVVENNGTKLERVRFRVSGAIKSASRVVSLALPGESRVIDEFELVFVLKLQVENSQLDGLPTTRFIHEQVRKTFAEGVYTDSYGTLQSFTEPRAPWWLSLTNIRYEILDAND